MQTLAAREGSLAEVDGSEQPSPWPAPSCRALPAGVAPGPFGAGLLETAEYVTTAGLPFTWPPQTGGGA